MIEKIRPIARIEDHHNDDGTREWKEIEFYCPGCGRHIKDYRSDSACDKCGTFYDWAERKPRIKVTYSVEW